MQLQLLFPLSVLGLYFGAERCLALKISNHPCTICNFGHDDSNAPVLMIRGRSDGTGRVLLEMLDGMAMAAKLNIKFAGSSYLSTGLDMQPHGYLLTETVPMALGISDFREVIKNKHPRKTIECDLTGGTAGCAAVGEGWSNRTEAASWVARVNDMQHQLQDDEWKQGLEAAWTPRFLKALRSQAVAGLKGRSLFLNSTKPLAHGFPTVAMHLRRGDVETTDLSWYTPDKYYESIVARIWKTYPKASIHIWSEGPRANFASFEHRGVHIHLNDHPIDALANLASAQIMVGAKGSFSHYAKVLNTNCVIVSKAETDFMLGSNPNWVDGDDDQSSQFAERLSSCVDRL